jgi:putative MATE family efflux protein
MSSPLTSRPHGNTSAAPHPMLHGPIAPLLIRMTGPVVLGILLILLFNVVDTYFVGLLGTRELAALSFTFPVSFIVMNIAMGLAVAATSVASLRLGQGETDLARRINGHALILSIAVIVPISLFGIAIIDPLFGLLGAGDDLLPLIRDYMVPWFLGVVFLAIPMTAHGAIRATGDTRTPSIVMGIAGLLNGILAPIFIFVLDWGVRGAAIATVISWIFASAAAVWALHRIGYLSFAPLAAQPWLRSFRELSKVAAPAAVTNLLGPLSAAIITAIVATHGAAAVAAFGVGTRIEALALVVIMALASAVSPFIGQNYGAGHHHRIAAGLRVVFQLSLGWALLSAITLYVCGGWLAQLFSEEASIQADIVLFLQLVPIGFAGLGLIMIIGAALNVLRRPVIGTAINVGRLFLLALPAAWIGNETHGLTGLFIGLAGANLLAGIAAVIWFRTNIRSKALTTLQSDDQQ